MKRPSLSALVLVALVLAAAPIFAENPSSRGPRVVTRTSALADQPVRIRPKAAAQESYSVQLNIVTRVQGTSFFRTAIDITNNTTSGSAASPVTADFQYCYTLGGVYQGCTPSRGIDLLFFQSFHTDDIVQYLGSLGVLSPGAETSSFGTFIVTFGNLPSRNGWEGTVLGRTYNPYIVNGAEVGTLAIAYPGSLFFESSSGTLVGLIRDTTTAPTVAGALRTNLGITNTDAITGLAGPVNVQLTFYDVTENSPTNGDLVGSPININGLQTGEVRQINNIFTAAGIPATVLSCIVFADITAGAPEATIEGYINILDGGTQDGAFFEMKCSVGCPTF